MYVFVNTINYVLDKKTDSISCHTVYNIQTRKSLVIRSGLNIKTVLSLIKYKVYTLCEMTVKN